MAAHSRCGRHSGSHAPDRVDPGGACPAAAGGAERLRAAIRAAAPDAQGAISHGVPAFKYRGRLLLSWGAAKPHAAFYVQNPVVMDAHRLDLAGYAISKGTIRFDPTRPGHPDLVGRLDGARLVEHDAAADRYRTR